MDSPEATVSRPEIRVRGQAEVRCLPDRAVLRLGVEAEADSQAQAFALASRSAAAADAVLDRFAAAIDRRLTAGVLVRPKTRWRKGETVRTGWVAARTTVLEVTDLARLGQLVSELPAAGVSAIDGPSWVVDATNPAHEQARRAAAIDAQHRADAYADALGRRVGALRWLAEPGLRPDGGGPGPSPVPHVARAYAATAAPEEPMDITPEEVTLQATVEACFELVDR
jgi:uncharacterized protein YggE